MHENLIYTACRLSNVKSIAWDFSLGYPFESIYKKDISLTLKPDIYLVNCNFRKDQYQNANQDYINSGNKLKIINCNCMQVNYAVKKSKKYNNDPKFSQNIMISIFDNNYGENSGLSYKFADRLAFILLNHKQRFTCVVHSKINRIYLENLLYKNKINIKKAPKGDFSLAYKSRLIISIGFQGAAIKAAFAFNKPIIFFVTHKNYYENMNFTNNKILNKKTIKVFNKLIFSNSEIESIFLKLITQKNYIKLRN